MFTDAQQEICDRYEAALDLPDLDSELGWSDSAVTGAEPLNGLRHRAGDGTCGWYLWGGEALSDDPDFFQPLHVRHVAEKCADVMPFLGLPPGWRFLIAPGHVDVWFDESLLEVRG